MKSKKFDKITASGAKSSSYVGGSGGNLKIVIPADYNYKKLIKRAYNNSSRLTHQLFYPYLSYS